MKRSSAYLTATCGGCLISLTLGAIVFGFDFWIVRLAETISESFGWLPAGYADSHLELTVDVAALLTLPFVVALFVWAWKKITAYELAAPEIETNAAPAD